MISDSNLIQYTGTIVANDAMPRSADPAPPMKRGASGRLTPEND